MKSSITNSKEITYIAIDRVESNKDQPRKYFDKKAIEDLSKSIKQYGVLQPIMVRLVNNNRFELVAGERRLRASKEANLQTIPAIIVNIDDKDSGVIALIENLQRQDLNYIEEAQGYVNLINEYNFTQEMLSEKVSKSQSTIANKIRLLRLSPKVRSILLTEGLTERHARALLKLDNEGLQLEVLQKIVDNNLNVAKTEELIEKIIAPKNIESKKGLKIIYKIKDFRIFKNSIKQTVNIIKNAGFETDYKMEETDEGVLFQIMVKK